LHGVGTRAGCSSGPPSVPLGLLPSGNG
jgi:hypothetical protein